MKIRTLGALAALGLFSGAALAQVPGLFITSPTGTEQVVVRNASPQVTNVYLRQMRDARGYSKQSPSTGFSLTFGVGQSEMQIGGSTTLATGTINLSAAPVDGKIECFFTQPAITALTLSGNGHTLNNAVTATAATTRYCYLYSLSNTTWDRVQ